MTAIRRAVPADAPALAQVHVDTWRAAYRGLIPDATLQALSPAESEQKWRRRLSPRRDNDIWVWEVDGRVVGFVTFGASRDEDADPTQTGEIYAIYLVAEAWGRGHGKALLWHALRSLKTQGFHDVTLWVLHDNRRAIRFYRSQGFQADGGSKVVERDAQTTLIEKRYRRPLPSYDWSHHPLALGQP